MEKATLAIKVDKSAETSFYHSNSQPKMNKQMHTVLGASGATGRAVMAALKSRNLTFNTVERSKKLEGVETIIADLLDAAATLKALQHSDYVYLCVGLPYHSKVWAKDWPILMHNVIEACEKAHAKLIFFDNVYMYGPAPLATPFDETHPQHPTTKKGLARKQTTDLLLEAIAQNRVKAVIGRSADFYGAFAVNSPFYISFLQNMLRGKDPQVLGKKGISHTYAYSGDNGKALVALALDESTYGQVWHLPVGEPITFEDVNALLNTALGTNFKLRYIPKIMRKILGIFLPPIVEVEEMLYQFEHNYAMNFHKFKSHFPDFQVTPYKDGITEMVQSFQQD
jgi:nucleoside-diphosphate-sugar epimerase